MTTSTQKTTDPRGILVVDLGAQYAQLIARRLREANAWCEIAPAHKALIADVLVPIPRPTVEPRAR